MNLKSEICLATRSPRRLELFRELKVPFRVVYSPDVEKGGGLKELDTDAAKFAMKAARSKTENAREVGPGDFCLGFDTVVVLPKLLLGKPENEEQAVEMLMRLSGREHRVITAIALKSPGAEGVRAEFESTSVSFGPVTELQARRYVSTGEPMDKAGAYGIQGKASIFIERIQGCYFNVVGLPIFRVANMLAEHGIDISCFWEKQN